MEYQAQANIIQKDLDQFQDLKLCLIKRNQLQEVILKMMGKMLQSVLKNMTLIIQLILHLALNLEQGQEMT
jgi:hypothetical protein